MPPRVIGIFIAPTAGAPMRSVQAAQAIAHAGLEGDRYSTGSGSWNKDRKGKRQISIMDLSAFSEANKRFVVPYHPEWTRRNIITDNVDLMSLIGKEFRIGPVKVRGVKYCEPCDRPDVLSKQHGFDRQGFKTAFEKTAGILVEVLNDGIIMVDDPVVTR
jgi:MOSC domain-containing protein YiiM